MQAPGDFFVRSLVAAGNCDGQRMVQVVRSLGREPSPIGASPRRPDVLAIRSQS